VHNRGEMDLYDIVERNQDVSSARVGSDVVILNLARDDYVALDEVGRRVWELLEDPCRVGDLCAQLAREFAGPAAQIEADVHGFLVELEREDLVRVTRSPG
jgi:hypothetical protein